MSATGSIRVLSKGGAVGRKAAIGNQGRLFQDDKGIANDPVGHIDIKKNRQLQNKFATVCIIGVPETIRTSDPFLRREVLYPAELRGQMYPFLYRRMSIIARIFRR